MDSLTNGKTAGWGTYLGLIITCAFWGTSFAVAKIGLYQLSPVNLVILRFILASVMFGGMVLLLKRDAWRIDWKDIPLFIWLGFIGVAAYFVVQYYCLLYNTTVNTSLIIGTSPIITGFLAARFGGEQVSRRHFLGMGVAFAGLVFLVTKGDFNLDLWSALGANLLVLLNACMWSLFTLSGKRVLVKYDPFVVVAYLSIIGTMLMLPLAVIRTPLTEPTLVRQFGSITLLTWGTAAYLALTCSVIGYFFWYRGVQRLGAAKTAMFNYVNPLVALLTSLILFDEGINGFVLLGGALVLTGVYLTMKPQPERPGLPVGPAGGSPVDGNS